MVNTKNVSLGRKRNVDVVILSDVHLGTYGCHAIELSNYLRTIKPAAALKNLGIKILPEFTHWLEDPGVIQIKFPDVAGEVTEVILEEAVLAGAPEFDELL